MSHLKVDYDPNLKLDIDLPWSSLKYGFCSYFALTYTDAFPTQKSYLCVFEYDRDLEHEYLVHVLVQTDTGILLDAENTYTTWHESVRDITDIEFMELGTREINKEQLTDLIKHDIGFFPDIHFSIKNFVKDYYTKEERTS